MTTPTLDEQIAMQKNRAEYWLGSGDREVQERAILASLEALRDIAAYFRKEADYERENMGAGGSRIALGRWTRYFTTLENVAQDLPELRDARSAPQDDGGGWRFCWLIERQIGGRAALRSMTSFKPEAGWTHDANEAMQFARKKDAEDFMAADCGEGEIYFAEAIEHGFAQPPALPRVFTHGLTLTADDIREIAGTGPGRVEAAPPAVAQSAGDAHRALPFKLPVRVCLDDNGGHLLCDANYNSLSLPDMERVAELINSPLPNAEQRALQALLLIVVEVRNIVREASPREEHATAPDLFDRIDELVQSAHAAEMIQLARAALEAPETPSFTPMAAWILVNQATQPPVEHGCVSGKQIEDHVRDFEESLSKGAMGSDGKIDLWGVYIAGTNTPICHTGNGPTSERNARFIEFAFNNMRTLLSDGSAQVTAQRAIPADQAAVHD